MCVLDSHYWEIISYLLIHTLSILASSLSDDDFLISLKKQKMPKFPNLNMQTYQYLIYKYSAFSCYNMKVTSTSMKG
jgi:hypothetical protein